jgi:hypothetical protein
MKEEVKDFETVERTQEKIYCDACGDECTDDHKIVPGHRCRDCRSGETEFDTVEKFKPYMEEKQEETHISFIDAVGLVVLFPLTVARAIEAIIEDGWSDRARCVMIGIYGTLLWLLILLLWVTP